jgi:fengycin family lipopeptide synthetase D
MIAKENLKNIYPLSPMQEGMLFHSIFDPESTAYFEQVSYRLAGALDVKLFRQSWNELFKHHDILRTVFIYEKAPRPLQLVLKNGEVEFSFEDIQNHNADRQEQFLEDYRQKDRMRKFNLSRDTLTRIAVFQLREHGYEVIWSFHHILMDGWSAGILIGELLEAYQSLLKLRNHNLPGRVPYNTYIEWLEKQDKEVSRKYWKDYLEGYEATATVPAFHLSTLKKEYKSADLRNIFEVKKTEQIRNLAAREQVTLYAVIQTIWGILLGRYNDSNDVVFGSVVSGRPAQVKGVEEMVGLFINTVPVRIRSNPGDTFRDLLQKVQKETIEGQDHLYLPLAETQNKQGMLDHIIVFESYPLDKQLFDSLQTGMSGLTIERVSAFEQTPYHFNFIVNPAECLEITIRFNEKVYNWEQMERLHGHLETIINAILENVEISVDNIDILTSEEKKQVIRSFNSTAIEFQRNKTIIDLFEEQVKNNPEQIAVLYQEEKITYRELNEKANAIAYYLRKNYQIKTEDRIAVAMNRSEWLAISFLGILKLGAVYVPIDPLFPRERIEFMLSDSNAVVVLSEEKYIATLPQSVDRKVIDIRRVRESGTDTFDTNVRVDTENLTYIIYTSGSTGLPKGVMIEHRGIINLMEHQRRILRIQQGDGVVQFASPSFDASVWEMCVALLHGGVLVIADQETVADPERFGNLLREEETTLALLPPSYLKMLDRKDVVTLKTIVSGGEAAQLDDALYYSNNIQYVNAYGPSETSIISSCHEVNPKRKYHNFVPIGAPIANTKIYILDSSRRLVPVGVPGEIYIGGVGLARGYQKLPDLTEEKFVFSPLGDKPDSRLYKTGDRARWLPDGNIEFLGRIDQQVKVRGFRIELEEIQTVLTGHPEVRDAVVITREENAANSSVPVGIGKQLVAYVVPHIYNGGQTPAAEKLRSFLGEALPDYMIPTFFVMLDAIPLTSNGKVDYEALPVPNITERVSDTDYAEPRTPSEKILAEIWSKVLGVERVGINDNFFDLGGHSLTATVVISNVRNKFQVETPMRALFESPTIAGLSAYIDTTKNKNRKLHTPGIERVARLPRRPKAAAFKNNASNT